MAYCNTNIQENEREDIVNGNQPIFSDFKTANYHKLNDYFMGSIFQRNARELGWTPNDMIVPANIQKITKAIRTYYENVLVENAQQIEGSEFLHMSDDVYLDIKETLLPNFEAFMAHYYKFNPIIKINNFELDEDVDEYGSNSNADDGNLSSVSDEEVIDVQGKEFDKGGQDEDVFQLAGKEMNILFRLLAKRDVDDNGNPIPYYTSEGIPTTADIGTTSKLLLSLMAGTRNEEEFKTKLTSKSVLMIVPEAKQLAEMLRIDKPGRTLGIHEYVLFHNFYNTFSKSKVPIQSLYKQDDGLVMVIDEVNGNINGIKKQFTSNFQTGKVVESMKQYLQKDPLQGYFLSKEHFPSKPTNTKEREDFLSLLGVTFTGIRFIQSNPGEMQNYEDMLESATDLLYDRALERVTNNFKLRDPIVELRKKEHLYADDGSIAFSLQGETTSVDKLLEFESKYSKVSPSLSARNAMGELQYLMSLDNQMTIATYHLNKAKTLDQLYLSPSFRGARYNAIFRNSYVVNYLFDKNGDKIAGRTIDLTNLSGFKNQITKKVKAKLERDLSDKEKMIQDFGMVMVEGRTDTLRTETSHTFFSVSLREEVKGKIKPKFYFTLNGFQDDFKSNYGFKKQTLFYLKAEVERVNGFAQIKKDNPTLTDNYGKFSIFHGVLENGNDELKKQVLKEELEMDSPTFLKLMDLYNDELEAEVNEYKSTMNRLGISFKELIPRNVKENKFYEGTTNDAYVRAFIANTLTQNIEFSILFSGDPSLFKGDFHKRLKGLSSTGDLASVLPLFKEFRNSTYEVDFHDRYSISGAIGKAYKDNNKTFNTQTLTEFKQSADFAYTSRSLVEGMRRSMEMRDRNRTAPTFEFIRDIMLGPKRFKQDPADGQGYISLDFHRELALRFGFWDDNMEKAYKWEGLIYRRDIKKAELTQIEADELESLEKQIMKNPEGHGLSVLKMTYWGGLENVKLDVKAFDKFSTAPLLPSDVRNHPTLSKLLTDMTQKQVGYVKYESGTKLFKTQPIDLDRLVDAQHDQYHTQLLKLQIKPHSHQRTGTAIPTQMLKLIFSSLFNEGKPTTEKVGGLYRTYIQTLKNIQGVQGEKLMKELGINEDGVNMEKMSQRLIEKAKQQGLNSNIIKGLEVKDGKLSGELEESGFMKQIIDLISGIADKKLRRFELAGGDFVLITNANRSKLNFYEFTEDGTKACDCRINLTKQFAKLLNRTHPDGQPIGTLERINGLLKDDNWRMAHKKELSIVLDRVPTQGPNSMDFAIVKEFLSPTSGNVIIMPDEIVFKSGTDFDYDKEKVLTPSFDEDGNYIQFDESTLASVNETLDGLVQEKRKIIGDTREYVAALRQEIRDSNKIKNKTVSEIKKYLQVLDNEEKTNYEYMKEGLQLLQMESEAPEDYEQFLALKGSDFLNAVFSQDFSSLKAQLDGDMVEFYRIGQEIRDAKQEMFAAINTFKLIKKEKLDSIYNVREKELEALFNVSDTIRDTIRKRSQLIENQGNKIIDTYKEILALPEMFAELVVPNTTRTVKPIAERQGARDNKTVDLPNFNRVFHYLENHRVKNIYFDSKNMLGPFAVDNTFMQLAHYEGVNINRVYYRFGDKTKKRSIHDIIISPEESKQINSEDNRIRTSLRDTIDDYIKQTFDSETINATVDAAKDPWFALLGITRQNIGVVNFMKNLGYPMERIILFINQPVIRKFVELQQNGMSKKDAIGAVGNMLNIYKIEDKNELMPARAYAQAMENPDIRINSAEKLKGNKYKVLFTENERIEGWQMTKIFQSIEDGEHIDGFEHIYDTVANTEDKLYDDDTLERRMADEIKPDGFNIQALGHFILMDQHNMAFRNYQYYFNFDTQKASTPSSIRAKRTLRDVIMNEGMFNKEDIEKMEKSSIMSAFINLNLMEGVYKQVFPILGRDDVQDTLNNITKIFNMSFDKNKRDVRTLPDVLDGDFITAIMFNFNKKDGESFIARNRHLLIKEEGKLTMSQRMENLKARPFYEQLSRVFPVLEQLTVSKHQIKSANDLNGLPQYTVLENIQLIKPSSETTVESEAIIEQFRNMQTYEFDFEDFSEDDNAKFSKSFHGFMNDLFTLGIVQNGIDKSSTGFSEYIPTEFRQRIFKDAFDNMKSIIENDPSVFKNFLTKFENQFKYNNPRYFPKYKIGKQTIMNENNYYYRFKNYDDRIGFVDIKVKSDEELETEETSTREDEVNFEPKDMNLDSTRIGFLAKNGETKQGYKTTVNKYPEFAAYLTYENKVWHLESPYTGDIVPVKSAAAEDYITELKTMVQGWKNTIAPENKPAINAECGQ